MINARQALYLARKYHEGQKRLTGDDYVWHCVSVAQHPLILEAGEELYAAALLHDIVEDTEMTLSRLAAFGASEMQTVVIDNVTHHGNEPNVDYIDRVMTHPGSALIKLADSLHNYDGLPMLLMMDGKNPKTGEEWSATHDRMRKKYQRNIRTLQDFLDVPDQFRTEFIDDRG